MKAGEYYAEDPKVMQVVRLGQELIVRTEVCLQGMTMNHMSYGMRLLLQGIL